ncbi:class I poly(R)-hydroxyalkanoic acid synthase [Azospirillum agricola]|uniref:hypothetical protein n=1 Tax=Azospirillum agricola TaxID=1720247 RepID=UPI001B3C11BC|nr:hypothetical protein [Azospirillum agricola]
MVSLQDFSQVGDTAVFPGEPTVDFIEQQMMERGYLDSREMSNMFNLLRSNDLIWSNVVNNCLMGDKAPAFDLGRIPQDVYAVGAEKDHIVPRDAAWRVTRLLKGGKVRYVLASSGHIAGIINPPGGKGTYWADAAGRDAGQPGATAQAWRGQATAHSGSWWTDWTAWLAKRSGRTGKPPALGSTAHPPLADAPGACVLEK